MRIDEADAVIKKTAGENEVCRRLVAIPGIGPITSTAIIAAIGNGAALKKGREFAAWPGIVPGEYTTGAKQKLLGISKRGNSYLRRLFVHGAAYLRLKTRERSSPLWTLVLGERFAADILVIVRLQPLKPTILDYFVIPALSQLRGALHVREENNAAFMELYHFTSLRPLIESFRRCPLWEVA